MVLQPARSKTIRTRILANAHKNDDSSPLEPNLLGRLGAGGACRREKAVTEVEQTHRHRWDFMVTCSPKPDGPIRFASIWLMWLGELWAIGFVATEEGIWMERGIELPLHLFASALRFPHPITGEPCTFEVPLPAWFENPLDIAGVSLPPGSPIVQIVEHPLNPRRSYRWEKGPSDWDLRCSSNPWWVVLFYFTTDDAYILFAILDNDKQGTDMSGTRLRSFP